jgi:hypothetical protein
MLHEWHHSAYAGAAMTDKQQEDEQQLHHSESNQVKNYSALA